MLIVVTGMHREALVVGQGGTVVVAGGSNASLAGRIEAAARGARAVLSIGIGGGLTRGLPAGVIVIARDVVWNDERFLADTRWRQDLAARLPDARTDTIAGSDGVVTTPAAKAALHRATGAALVDMESHVAARTAAACDLPFAALRVISDSADRTLPPAALVAIGPDGKLKLGAVLRSIAARPGQIAGLIRTGRDNRRAMASLGRCAALLGPGFACPYLG
ncbi:phosphorylase [Reyranella sp. CPCC 100927]|uniref:phosphorylase family protein n=1 Tax=Reyranella sp. CPCC 100927 TaxID=2599616 RepID=UPI0011B39E11|nr:phosphorylase [Reyranella sp. CPCC 100927]TWT00731.1 phosphorylase [Reyranella sp. CPCC 100927]